MTGQERHQEFMAEYRKLVQRTGYQITPAIESRQYGNAVMVEPVAHILPVPDWQPPLKAESSNSKPQTEKKEQTKLTKEKQP